MKDQSKTGQARSESERTKVEQALKERDERYRAILENIQEGYYEVDLAGNYTFFNTSMSKILGYTEEEMMGMNYRLYMDKENAKKVYRDFNEVYRTGISSKVDYEQIKKDGSTMHVETSIALMRDSSGQPTSFRGIVRDITDRMRAEEALQQAHDELERRVADRTEELMRVNEELRTEITERKRAEEDLKRSEAKFRELTDSLPQSVFEMDLRGILTYVNSNAFDLFGYTQKDLIKGLNAFEILIQENREKAGENIGKIMQGEILGGIEYTVQKKNGETFPVEIYSRRALHDGKPIGIRGIIIDITERKRAEERLNETLESLRKAVGTTIQVMVSAVETRDPYTAGHQIRSADLARAIATEMGLPQGKIDAIRMAGSIHDIGKLSTPAEILSKPTKLSELEFGLIKEHSRKGYEMLKDVESPWPLAEIVYQHHERMDGSGYPRNLKGDDILMEARILAVADVVESMASHRPYRAGLGIDAALTEIENNKGTLYDAAAAGTCLSLFREKGYQLDLK